MDIVANIVEAFSDRGPSGWHFICLFIVKDAVPNHSWSLEELELAGGLAFSICFSQTQSVGSLVVGRRSEGRLKGEGEKNSQISAHPSVL